MPHHVPLLLRLFPVLGRVESFRDAPPTRFELEDLQEVRSLAFQALRELFSRLADRQLMIVTIDDLQWADEDSKRLLRALMQPPRAPRLLLLTAMRTSGDAEEARRAVAALVEAFPERPHVLALDPLSPRESRQLAEALAVDQQLDQPETSRRLEQIAREAAGHPLFIREMVQHARGLQERETNAAAGEILRLDDALWARINLLDQGAKDLVELVAVAGGPLPQGVMRRRRRDQRGGDVQAERPAAFGAPAAHRGAAHGPHHRGLPRPRPRGRAGPALGSDAPPLAQQAGRGHARLRSPGSGAPDRPPRERRTPDRGGHVRGPGGRARRRDARLQARGRAVPSRAGQLAGASIGPAGRGVAPAPGPAGRGPGQRGPRPRIRAGLSGGGGRSPDGGGPGAQASRRRADAPLRARRAWPDHRARGPGHAGDEVAPDDAGLAGRAALAAPAPAPARAGLSAPTATPDPRRRDHPCGCLQRRIPGPGHGRHAARSLLQHPLRDPGPGSGRAHPNGPRPLDGGQLRGEHRSAGAVPGAAARGHRIAGRGEGLARQRLRGQRPRPRRLHGRALGRGARSSSRPPRAPSPRGAAASGSARPSASSSAGRSTTSGS